MHPVQATPRQSLPQTCKARQRKMHPVQATPRQRIYAAALQSRAGRMHPVQVAPRQSAMTTRSSTTLTNVPRAGSAKQNNSVPPNGPLTTGRHFFTFHPSRIPTALPSFSVTMYNPVPIFLTDPAWRSRIFPTVTMLSVTGRPRGFSWCGGSPWE